jgi:hypothetical protein
MVIVLVAIIIGILLAVLAWQRAGYVTAAATLTALSICSYAGYALYMGLYLGDYPAWYFEGKFLAMPFSLLAIVGSAYSLVAVALSLISLQKEINAGKRAKWSQIGILGVASTSAAMCVLLIYQPIGLGIAYQIAELKRGASQFENF